MPSPDVRLFDPNGQVITPTPGGYIPLGSGYSLSFDDSSLQGKITPALASRQLGLESGYYGNSPVSFAGSDLRIMIEAAAAKPAARVSL